MLLCLPLTRLLAAIAGSDRGLIAEDLDALIPLSQEADEHTGVLISSHRGGSRSVAASCCFLLIKAAAVEEEEVSPSRVQRSARLRGSRY